MRNEKPIYLFFLVFLFLIAFVPTVFAQSDYVLPYPSSMPGNLYYKFHLIYEGFSKYWYFGDFGQFNYNLKMADKYLVEAKTLFEYKQYFLGYQALNKSNQYYVNVLPNLIKAEKNGKNILQKKELLGKASQKHIEFLQTIENSLPGTFIWEPERSTPITLNLKKTFDESIYLRERNK